MQLFWFFQTKFAQKWIQGWKLRKINVGIKVSILSIFRVPIFKQNRQLWLFLAQTCWKINLGLEIQKTNVSKNHHPQDSMCANFHVKGTILTFLTQICPKMDLGLEIHKTNVGIRIIILEILCVPICANFEEK